jgi:periplasmic protein TonB
MKPWILPALFALGIHALFFSLHFDWTPPAFTITESRAVTISLVEAMRAPAPQPRIEPLAPPRARPIKPLQALPDKARPVPTPAPLPSPQSAPTASDAPVSSRPPPVGSSSPASAAAEETAPAVNPKFGPDQAKVQASVPLYELNPPPVYPALARRRNYQGTVKLDVLVDRQGRAAQIRVAQSSGYPILDRSAIESVRRWRFEPARRSGRPIEMWVQVPVRFALE